LGKEANMMTQTRAHHSPGPEIRTQELPPLAHHPSSPSSRSWRSRVVSLGWGRLGGRSRLEKRMNVSVLYAKRDKAMWWIQPENFMA
jgi:hypothetical protein